MNTSDRQPPRLSPMQERILRFIASRPGYPPSLQEISREVGLGAKSNVFEHIARLVARGLLTRGAAKKARSLRLTEAACALLGIEKMNIESASPGPGLQRVPVFHSSAALLAHVRRWETPHPVQAQSGFNTGTDVPLIAAQVQVLTLDAVNAQAAGEQAAAGTQKGGC